MSATPAELASNLAANIRVHGRGATLERALQHYVRATRMTTAADAMPAHHPRRETRQTQAREHLLLSSLFEAAYRATRHDPGVVDRAWIERQYGREVEAFERDPGDYAVMLHRRLDHAAGRVPV